MNKGISADVNVQTLIFILSYTKQCRDFLSLETFCSSHTKKDKIFSLRFRLLNLLPNSSGFGGFNAGLLRQLNPLRLMSDDSSSP